MKKDAIFAPAMLVIGILLALFDFTGTTAHIVIAAVGIFVLAIYTSATKKEWRLPALEILMRVFYAAALITGVVALAVDAAAPAIAHKVCAALFVVLLVVLFVQKLAARKK